MKKHLEACPHCGSKNGYYRKVYMKGRTQYNYTFDGSEARNDELHSGLEYRESKTTYCIKCDTKIKII